MSDKRDCKRNRMVMLRFTKEQMEQLEARLAAKAPGTPLAKHYADELLASCVNGNGKHHTDADAIAQRVLAELGPLFDRLFKLLELNAHFGAVVPRGEHEYADIEAWYSQFIAAKLNSKE